MNTSTKQIKYTFKGKVWKYKGPVGWYFVTLPKKLSKTIRDNHGFSEEGWGRLKTTATLKNYKWQTAIWFDTKVMSYLLPIKSSVRKSTDVTSDKTVSITLLFLKEKTKFSLFKIS